MKISPEKKHGPQFRVYYDMYKISGTCTIEQVKNKTDLGYLTPEDFEEITGQKYKK